MPPPATEERKNLSNLVTFDSVAVRAPLRKQRQNAVETLVDKKDFLPSHVGVRRHHVRDVPRDTSK